MPRSANLNIMIKAARSAGRSLVKDFREVENLQVSSKSAGDFVSRADITAEKIIKDMLLAARPTYGWIGEESGETAGKDPTRRWIVDPLDGTTNFLHGLPHWAVSIALEHKGKIVTGVVYDVCKDEMFFAERGEGAWMNENKRLRVSDRHQMLESIYATGLPFSAKSGLTEALLELSKILPECAGVRRWGAAALDLVYVAAGRYEGFWERGLNIWDIAAGIVIAREAGAIVEGFERDLSPEASGNIICAGEHQFDRFAKLLRSA